MLSLSLLTLSSIYLLADLDDNSIDGNDLYNVSGREADKPAASDSRQGDPTPLNGGQLPPASQTPSELEDLVLNMSELAQKAVSLFRCSQRQSSLERGQLVLWTLSLRRRRAGEREGGGASEGEGGIDREEKG